MQRETEDVINVLERPVFEETKVEELYEEFLMSAKALWKCGKGYEDLRVETVVGLERRNCGDIYKLFTMAGY